MIHRVCLIILGVLLFPLAALADCANPAGVPGQVIYNADQNVPQVCAASTWIALGALNPGAGGIGCANPTGVEGQIIYNADIHVPQYCDGDDWRMMINVIDSGGGGCTAPSDCSTVGDVCSDGSIFAGFVLYSNSSCEPLYVTDNNQSTSSQWKNATGTDDISTDDHVDGKANAAGRGGSISNFPAFDLCESNTYHGKTDWYLPARAELNLLWLNRAAINANAAGNFTTSYYWSSTEDTTGAAWSQNFNGTQLGTNKTSTNDVRCVRRD